MAGRICVFSKSLIEQKVLSLHLKTDRQLLIELFAAASSRQTVLKTGKHVQPHRIQIGLRLCRFCTFDLRLVSSVSSNNNYGRIELRMCSIVRITETVNTYFTVRPLFTEM